MHLNRSKQSIAQLENDHMAAEEQEEPKKDNEEGKKDKEEPKKESNGSANPFSKRAQDLAEAQ